MTPNDPLTRPGGTQKPPEAKPEITKNEQGQFTCIVKVTNPTGFHIRPMVRLTELVAKHKSKVMVVKGNYRAVATSPISLLGAATDPGSELRLEADGEDAQEVLTKIIHLFAVDFHQMDLSG